MLYCLSRNPLSSISRFVCVCMYLHHITCIGRFVRLLWVCLLPLPPPAPAALSPLDRAGQPVVVGVIVAIRLAPDAVQPGDALLPPAVVHILEVGPGVDDGRSALGSTTTQIGRRRRRRWRRLRRARLGVLWRLDVGPVEREVPHASGLHLARPFDAELLHLPHQLGRKLIVSKPRQLENRYIYIYIIYK